MSKNNEALLEALADKWNPLIECESEAKIVGHQKKIATAILLENQEQALQEQAAAMSTIAGQEMAGYDPVLIPMIRRAIPQMIAFDIVGVQPMTLPTGLVFARRAMYDSQKFGVDGYVKDETGADTTTPNRYGREALFNEAEVDWGGNQSFDGVDPSLWTIGDEPLQGSRMGLRGIGRGVGANYITVEDASATSFTFYGTPRDAYLLKTNTPLVSPSFSDGATVQSASYDADTGLVTVSINGSIKGTAGEGTVVQIPLYTGRGYIASYAGEGQADDMKHITMRIEKIAVEAETHQLRTGYSIELAQDMRRLHNMDAEAELIDIMSKELVAEQNRVVLRDLYNVAKPACQTATVPGVWDYNLDSDGRWSNEKFKGLLFNIWRDANRIGVETRMGVGNILVVSPNVASGLAAAGALDFAPAIQNLYNLQNADFTQNTFAGVIDGKMNVYIDPYADGDFYMVGFKGASAMEAGYFLCPYIPAQIMRATDPFTLQPMLGMKMRYGRTYNPLSGSNQFRRNCYYRIAGVTNLGADGYAGFAVTDTTAGVYGQQGK